MHQHLSTVNAIEVILDEFPFCSHSTCLWIDHVQKTIDCFDPQLSVQPSDLPLADALLPGYTFRSKSQRANFLCPQYIRQVFRIPMTALISHSDRFCELDCLLYCQTRFTSSPGMNDMQACSHLTRLTTDQRVEDACRILHQLVEANVTVETAAPKIQ